MQLTSPTVTVLFFASQRIWHGILRGYCTPGLLLRKPAGLRIELDAASSNVVFSSGAFAQSYATKNCIASKAPGTEEAFITSSNGNPSRAACLQRMQDYLCGPIRVIVYQAFLAIRCSYFLESGKQASRLRV